MQAGRPKLSERGRDLAVRYEGGAAVGLLTSGGTESILLPVLGYREWARAHKPPEAVAAPEVRLSAI